ncbi:MAG: hypothetical protein JRE58_13215 [Deltaproteobacteria bacterium]|nr:hypothetical protein [Deltaproteobacteria bacterium]
MTRAIKRMSWTDTFQDDDDMPQIKKEYLFQLDDRLYSLWALGRNIILVWAPDGRAIEVILIPHYLVAEIAGNVIPAAGDNDLKKGEAFLNKIIAGPKQVTLEELYRISRLLDCKPERIDLPIVPGKELSYKIITALVKRYSITLIQDRAVALFDAVKFSLYPPLEQVTQLNSLAYSVNTAFHELTDRQIKINFARSTTGDGFYVWNRTTGARANVDLYHFMQLVLADNAIARTKARGNTVPLLRTCFHIGDHYEFYQAEGLSPTTFSYIVGDVTIDLARMISQAGPGQVLMGNFNVSKDDAGPERIEKVDTINFMENVKNGLSQLNGMVLSGDNIDSIQCYLTGDRKPDGSYTIKQYSIADKHGFKRNVFNAKVNIYRTHADPIFLGVQDNALADFKSAGQIA